MLNCSGVLLASAQLTRSRDSWSWLTIPGCDLLYMNLIDVCVMIVSYAGSWFADVGGVPRAHSSPLVIPSPSKSRFGSCRLAFPPRFWLANHCAYVCCCALAAGTESSSIFAESWPIVVIDTVLLLPGFRLVLTVKLSHVVHEPVVGNVMFWVLPLMLRVTVLGELPSAKRNVIVVAPPTPPGILSHSMVLAEPCKLTNPASLNPALLDSTDAFVSVASSA